MYNMGQYIPGESVIHRLDPRVKIASVIGLSIMILEGELLTATMITIFLTALIPTSGLVVRHIWKALRPIGVFISLLFFLHLIFTDGTPIPPFPSWRVTITYEGLCTGSLIAWQFCLLIVSASILTMTTSPTELVMGIERLLRPLKVIGIPSHDIAIMVSIALRFVPTLLEELARIKEAQMARGACFHAGNLLKRARGTTTLLIPLVLSAFRRADELATAMEGRGYKRGPRTYMKHLSMSQADYATILVMVLVTGIHILQNRLSLGGYLGSFF